MEIPLQISFHQTQPHEAIDREIRDRVARLERLYDRITSCRVAVEMPHRHHESGNHYRVRVDLKVPGAEIAVGRDPGQDGSHADVYMAITDAFDAAERRLKEHVRKQRGD